MTIRARDLFPDTEERSRVKAMIDLFNGKVVSVVDTDKELKFGTTYKDTRTGE